LIDQENRKAERELEMQKLRLQLENEEKIRQTQLERDRLELERINAGGQGRERNVVQGFRIDIAAKLLPKFDSSDVESYLNNFDRLAILNSWPEDKLCPILQSQLSGNALKVFTELTIEDSQSYEKVKTAILTAYQLTSEVYRRRFRECKIIEGETFSDFAFRLRKWFKRWLETVNVYDKLEELIETLLIEQFNQVIPQEINVWLLDHKPTTLVQAAQKADEYVSIRKPFTQRQEQPTPVHFNFRHHNNVSRTNNNWNHRFPDRNRFNRSSSLDRNSRGRQDERGRVSSEYRRDNASDRGNLFCTYCSRTNHNVQNCFFQKQS